MVGIPKISMSKKKINPFIRLSFDFLHADKSIKGGHPGHDITTIPGSVTSHDHSRAKFQR